MPVSAPSLDHLSKRHQRKTRLYKWTSQRLRETVSSMCSTPALCLPHCWNGDGAPCSVREDASIRASTLTRPRDTDTLTQTMHQVYTPEDSPRRTRSAEAAVRKRQRDRDCQRRKRQREREYTENLEAKVRQLQSRVDNGSPAGGTAVDILASASHSPASPPANHIQSKHSETVTVSLHVLESCLAAPRWARVPFNGLSLTSDPAHCLRGKQLPIFIKGMRANTHAEDLCPPDPKVIDILYGGSKNILANVIVEACSKEPLLPPEKLATNFALYKYCRVSLILFQRTMLFSTSWVLYVFV